ncbi:MAG: hypothetical protein WC505_06095 [Patescibacteria group bacterium]
MHKVPCRSSICVGFVAHGPCHWNVAHAVQRPPDYRRQFRLVTDRCLKLLHGVGTPDQKLLYLWVGTMKHREPQGLRHRGVDHGSTSLSNR